MRKRKVAKYRIRSEFLVVLVIVLLIFGIVVLRVSQTALGDENQGEGRGRSSEHNAASSNDVHPTEIVTPTIVPTTIVTAAPTSPPAVKESAQMDVVPTETPEVRTTTSSPTIKLDQTSQVSLPVINQPEIQTVPLSGRSVVNSQLGTGSVPKTKSGGSIIDVIKRGIDSMGGEKTTNPTPAPAPMDNQPETNGDAQTYLDQIKLKYQMTEGQLSLSAEDKTGNAIAIDESKLREVESSILNQMEKKGITLSLTTGNQLALIDNNVTAITDLPVLVDVDTRSLVVSTGGGLMPIVYLPDKALKNIIDLGIIASVNTQVVPKIDYSGGDVVYKFEATKVYKVLGKFSVTVPITITVSASSGDVVSRAQPFFTRMVSLISL